MSDTGRHALPDPPKLAAFALVGVVAWLLAFSRWGAYVGVAADGIYLTDVVLAVVVIASLVRRDKPMLPSDLLGRLTLGAVTVYLTWSLLRLLTSAPYGGALLRDAAPYAYYVVVWLVLITGTAARRARLWLIAFSAHALWLGFSLWFPATAAAFPDIGRTQVFAIRGDWDTAVCGMTIAFYLACLLSGQLRRSEVLWGAVVTVMSAVEISRLASRAGLLAGMAACLVVVVCTGGRLLVTRLHRMATRLAAAGVALLLAAGAVVLAIGTTPGQRLLATFDTSTVATSGPQAAGGTTRARIETWNGVSNYILARTSRTVFGVGFGPDFLHDSHSAAPIAGPAVDVRAPHNNWLNTWARLGVIGLVLEIVTAVFAAALAVRTLLARPDPLAGLAAVLVIGIPVVASLGVVLESPFGAVPYAFSIGVLVRQSRRGEGELDELGLADESPAQQSPESRPGSPARATAAAG